MSLKNNIYFVCEQDGEVEREFKRSLLVVLSKYNKRVRVYLAQVKYNENDSEFNVALCFMTESGEEEYLLHESVKIFKSMFGTKEHLDVIFLNQEQELAVRQICCPFFVSEDYQVRVPDFYLTSSEGYGLNHPIACFKRKRLYGEHPDGYLLCDIKPALIGQPYGRGSENIKQLILANRHQGYSLFPIKQWPSYVHVAIPLSNTLESSEHINENDIKLIAWGELYQSEIDALGDKE